MILETLNAILDNIQDLETFPSGLAGHWRLNMIAIRHHESHTIRTIEAHDAPQWLFAFNGTARFSDSSGYEGEGYWADINGELHLSGIPGLPFSITKAYSIDEVGPDLLILRAGIGSRGAEAEYLLERVGFGSVA